VRTEVSLVYSLSMTSEEPRWDVLIGYRSPSWWIENGGRGEKYLQVTSGDRKRPPLTSESINWDELGMTPRWLGDDTSECVAAIQPKNMLNQGSAEWARFRNGAQQRSEIALVISMVGGSEERSGFFGDPTAPVRFPTTARKRSSPAGDCPPGRQPRRCL
jgi:hypothetical protein